MSLVVGDEEQVVAEGADDVSDGIRQFVRFSGQYAIQGPGFDHRLGDAGGFASLVEDIIDEKLRGLEKPTPDIVLKGRCDQLRRKLACDKHRHNADQYENRHQLPADPLLFQVGFAPTNPS